MMGIFPVQLNDSWVLCSDFFVRFVKRKGLSKESGVDFLADGSSDSTGGGTFDLSIPVTFWFPSVPNIACPSTSASWGSGVSTGVAGAGIGFRWTTIGTGRGGVFVDPSWVSSGSISNLGSITRSPSKSSYSEWNHKKGSSSSRVLIVDCHFSKAWAIQMMMMMKCWEFLT